MEKYIEKYLKRIKTEHRVKYPMFQSWTSITIIPFQGYYIIDGRQGKFSSVEEAIKFAEANISREPFYF